jgi:Trk-type K+ transport system membrane component
VLDRELLTYLAIVAFAVFFVWGVLVFEGSYADSALRALRDSAFTVTRIVTTTGFVTADFDTWEAREPRSRWSSSCSSEAAPAPPPGE